MSNVDRYKRRARMNRALKQRMYLLSAEFVNPTYWNFEVEGSTGTKYKVIFKSTGMNCSCPYVKTSHKTCKHMFFIIGRICKLSLDYLNTDSHRVNPFGRYRNLNEVLNLVLYSRQTTTQTEIIPNNNIEDDCVICFESMKTGTLHDCSTCKNHFHKDCISRWTQRTRNCPLCRQRIYVRPKECSVDAMSKLQIRQETREEKLEKVINFLKTNYRPFFSKSERPRRPNTNETILKSKLQIPDDKTANQIIDELQQKAKRPYGGAISKSAIEKCEKYNCWLFC